MPKRISLSIALTIVMMGCDSGSNGASKQDAGSHATVSVPDSAAAAQQVCDTLDQCDGVDLFVSKRECAKQLGPQFEADLPKQCFECVAEITCAGWRAISNGERRACDICHNVCSCSVDFGGTDGSGGTGGFSDSCTPGSQSTPGADNDPCPQTDPKCPAAMYAAIATCGLDGKWSKDAFGSIMCACVPRSAGSGGASSMMGPSSVCGNGRVEPPEQCEGGNLNNATCTSLGLGVGLLSCDAPVCRFDTTQCGAAPGQSADEDGGT